MFQIFARPIGVFVRIIYDLVNFLDTKMVSSYAIAILLASIVLKFALLPLMLKQTESMKKIQDLNPEIAKLKKKYKDDPKTLNQKTQELYKENGANPMGGCLPLLIQFPILIAFFYVLRDPAIYVFNGDVAFYESINKSFLWIKDLGYAENYVFGSGEVNGISIGTILPFIGNALPVMAALSAFTTFYSSKMMQNSQLSMDETQKMTQNTMTFMMPAMIFFVSLNFPTGLTLYWTVSNVFQIVQQYVKLKASSQKG